MEDPEDLLEEIVSDWGKVTSALNSYVDHAVDAERTREIFEQHATVFEEWKVARQRRIADGKESQQAAIERLRSGIVELLLWQMLQSAVDPSEKKQLLLGLWKCLLETIEYAATTLLGGARKAKRDWDRLEDMMQDGFLQFESKVARYDPNRNMLRTFVRSCFRNHFINYMKRNNRSHQTAETAIIHSQLDEKHASEIKQEGKRQESLEEQRQQLDSVLQEISASSPENAERVEAFRLIKVKGMKIHQVRDKLGRSEGWISKWSNRIEIEVRQRCSSDSSLSENNL